MRYAVYNLSIHPLINLRTNLRINLRVMLSSFSSRLFSSLLFALLFLVEASAQNWAGAEGLPARKPWPWKC